MEQCMRDLTHGICVAIQSINYHKLCDRTKFYYIAVIFKTDI